MKKPEPDYGKVGTAVRETYDNTVKLVMLVNNELCPDADLMEKSALIADCVRNFLDETTQKMDGHNHHLVVAAAIVYGRILSEYLPPEITVIDEAEGLI